ncbi:hypothetical protein [Dyella telluris]|uniref:Uncharacterized protein n=1 Tax=Dyella telluris TaxID=2763498 RepID=A0A7G8Q1Q8_9GAMM|nr:hypothetical protein [Dyella telluris]QNK00716.1 hypothetical protein H8F01_16735 [Dyella telluris]
MRIAAALVSVFILVLGQIVIAHGPPFIPRPYFFLFRDAVLLLIPNAMIWLSRRSDWSMQTRTSLMVSGWIWLVVQLGCAIYLVHSGV